MNEDVRGQLAGILEVLREGLGEVGSVAVYEEAARKLWRAAGLLKGKGLADGWTWRYVQGVERGSVRPGVAFQRAVALLGEEMDGRAAGLTGLVEVRVLAREGSLMEGTVVLGKARVCARPGCVVRFVGRSPRQVFCSVECRRRSRAGKK